MIMGHGLSYGPRTSTAPARVAAGPGTLRFALSGFLTEKEADNLSPNTIDYYRRNIASFIAFLEAQGVSRLADLSKDHFTLFKSAEMDSGRSASGVHAIGRAVKAFLRWLALDEELIDERIILRLRLPRVPKKVIKPFSLDQVQLALDTAKGERMRQAERDTAILLLLFDTGIRSSELCGILDSDLEGERLLIRGKGSKERWARISPRTRKAIWTWLNKREALWPREDEDGPLFITRSGEAMDKHSLKKLFNRLKRFSGISGVRCSPHDCRHTFAIEMLRSGADSLEVQKLLGHETLTMTLNYAKMNDDDAAKAHKRHSLVDRLKRTGRRR
jgi:site-specific recombinase XerD